MESKYNIPNVLERFGEAWPKDASVVDGVMRAIEAAPMPAPRPRWRNTVIKSLLATAVAIAVLALAWEVISDRNSLYAQVIEAVRNARTLHNIQYVLPKPDAEPVKVTESWFERAVGFREEGLGRVRLGNTDDMWSFSPERKTAVRSKSNGIALATAPVFAEIDGIARELKDEYQRCPESDKTLDGQPSQAYLLTKLDRYCDSHLKAGDLRVMVFLDPQSRLVRAEDQWREGDIWVTKSFISVKYDEPIDPKLFQPDFGKDVKIVDADAAFDEFVDLKAAIHVEERSGLIYAIHRVERFENGGVLVVSSVRGTDETLKKYPLKKRRIRPGEYLVDGPARLSGSDTSNQLHLAWASHQGIDVSWWAMMQRPYHDNAASARIKLPASIEPNPEFANSFPDKDSGKRWYWEIELNVPRQATIPSIEDIATRIYADQVALDAIPFKSLDISSGRFEGTAVFSDINEISAAEYAKAVARKFRARMEYDINYQIDGQFERKDTSVDLQGLAPEQKRQVEKAWAWMRSHVTIGLSYRPLVDNATLERVAKRPSVMILYLRGTRITDEGLKHLSGLTKLENLDLAETGITDAGLRYLTGLSSLKRLDLTDTKVTAQGVAALQQALPQIKLKWAAKR